MASIRDVDVDASDLATHPTFVMGNFPEVSNFNRFISDGKFPWSPKPQSVVSQIQPVHMWWCIIIPKSQTSNQLFLKVKGKPGKGRLKCVCTRRSIGVVHLHSLLHSKTTCRRVSQMGIALSSIKYAKMQARINSLLHWECKSANAESCAG